MSRKIAAVAEAIGQRLPHYVIDPDYPETFRDLMVNQTLAVRESILDINRGIPQDGFGICVVDNMAQYWEQQTHDLDEAIVFGEDGIVKPWMQIISPWPMALFETKISNLIYDTPVLMSAIGDKHMFAMIDRFDRRGNPDGFDAAAAGIRTKADTFGHLNDDLSRTVGGEPMFIQIMTIMMEGVGRYHGDYVLMGQHNMTLDREGLLVDDFWLSCGESALYLGLSDNYETRFESAKELATSLLIAFDATVMLACAFGNIKNVSIEKTSMPDKLRKKHTKKQGYPPIDFSVVKVLKSMGGSSGKGGGDVKSFHPVRGHFKNYPNGLFGNPDLAGTYWWEATTRGDRSIGTKVTEYSA